MIDQMHSHYDVYSSKLYKSNLWGSTDNFKEIDKEITLRGIGLLMHYKWVSKATAIWQVFLPNPVYISAS